MTLIADDPINETHEFTNQFVLFPIGSGRENPGERPTSRLSREQIDAFLSAEFDNARNAHFFVPPAEPPAGAIAADSTVMDPATSHELHPEPQPEPHSIAKAQDV